MRVSLMRSADGLVTDVHWLVRDVTEQRAVAESLRALTAETERRITERTAQLEAALHVTRSLATHEQGARIAAESRLAELRADAHALLLTDRACGCRRTYAGSWA